MARTDRPALLVIDMISAFDFPEAPALHAELLRAARRIRALRARFHALGHPVVYANDNFAHWRADFRELVAMAAASGSTGQAVSALLQPCPQDYFVLKPKHSAFLATALPQRKRQALSLIASSRAGSVVSSRQVLREGS